MVGSKVSGQRFNLDFLLVLASFGRGEVFTDVMFTFSGSDAKGGAVELGVEVEQGGQKEMMPSMDMEKMMMA